MLRNPVTALQFWRSGRSEIPPAENLSGTGEMARPEAVMLWCLVAPLAALLLAMAWRSTLLIPIGYNEGWNAYWATAAVSGHALYLSPDALRTNNYPPLSFFIVGAASSLFHDAVFAGRIVNWIAFLGTGVLIAAILRAFGNDRVAAFSGSAIFVAYLATQYTDYVGVADPQMLAHGLMSLGLLALVRSNLGTHSLVGAAIMMTLALFTKHTLIAVPLASAIWLFVYDRRAAVRLVALLATCGLVGLATCRLAFGQNFITSLLAPRLYGVRIAYDKLFKWLSPMQVPLGIGSLVTLAPIRDRGAVLFATYAVVAFAVGSAAAMGEGVSFNSLFDLVIAFSLAVGHLIGRLGSVRLASSRTLRAFTIAIVGVSLLFGAAGRATLDELRVLPWIDAMRAKEAATRSVVRTIAAMRGPALCAMPSICYWAGKPFEVDLYNYTEAASAGAHDEAKLLGLIQKRYFLAVQTQVPLIDGPGEALAHPYWRALDDHYRPLHLSRAINIQLFVPR